MIYAISDIHGDYKQALRLLLAHDVIDLDGNWAAGTSTLVNCGDSTDRGNAGIDVLKLFHKLQKQAKEAGGRVIHLMGNHDAMILNIAQLTKNGDYDPEHVMVFKGNGGKMSEANALANSRLLFPWVQNFPLMCKVDDYLFQHADGFHFYETCINKAHPEGERTPESLIRAANDFVLNKAASAWGSWNIFFDMTDARWWDYNTEYITDYLQKFDAKHVVHGHTGHKYSVPVYYNGNKTINIDAIMSRGYRDDEERGCVLVVDSPGTNIIV